jgi:hypothetical protein
MGYNIEWINTEQPVADYSKEAIAEFEASGDDGVDKYTEQFEADYSEQLKDCGCDDIGGLVVYVNKGTTTVRAVYDYDNFVGWVAA